MELTVRWPDSFKCPSAHFQDFIQKMANRWLQGHTRFGLPGREWRYMSRLEKELKAYKRTGNVEHLFNIANYAGLEMQAPENPLCHFNANASSATRHSIK